MPLPAVSQRTQLILVPADQRRNEQAREVEIVVGLHREAHRGEQVLDGQRLVQMQAVDAGDGHSGREQPRDDERGELAAAAHEDEDIAGVNGRPVEASNGASSTSRADALGQDSA